MKFHEFTARKYRGSTKESNKWVTIATGRDLPLFSIRAKEGIQHAAFSIDLANDSNESWHL